MRSVYGKPFDPIYTDALSAGNLSVNTIFTSPGLVLVGVSWPWAVALKLVRYEKPGPMETDCHHPHNDHRSVRSLHTARCLPHSP